MALAIFITGSQSGSVISVTKISPFLKLFKSSSLTPSCEFKIFTFPDPILSPTEIPVTNTFFSTSSFILYSIISFDVLLELTVSGLA